MKRKLSVGLEQIDSLTKNEMAATFGGTSTPITILPPVVTPPLVA